MQNDILLINIGKYSNTRTYGQMLREPTMGLYVLGEYLSDKGFKVDILDGAYQRLDKIDILKKVDVSTVIGFYGVYTNMEAIFKLSSLIKLRKPDSTIIVGGPNWPAGKDILLTEPNIDIVVKEGAEYSVEQIILQLNKSEVIKPETIKGIFLRFKGQIIDTGTIANSAPVAVKPIFIQFEVPTIKKSILKLIGTKGCPNRCSFCPSPKFTELTPIEDLITVMGTAWNKGIDTFYIADENFCPPKLFQRAIFMSKRIKKFRQKRNRKVYLKLFLEPQTPLYVLNHLSKVAHITAFVGFENFSDKTLAFLGKNTNRQKNLSFWNAAKKAKVNVIPGIIALHPFLSPKELLDIIDILAMYDALSWRLLLKKLDLYPGTNLLSKMKSEYPFLLKDDFSSFMRPSSWNYAYDQNLGMPILTNIEKAFTLIGDYKDVKKLYSLMFDLNFVMKDGEIAGRYNSIRSDFVRHTRKLAIKIIEIITRDPNVDLKNQLEPAMSQYLNMVKVALKNCRKLFIVTG